MQQMIAPVTTHGCDTSICGYSCNCKGARWRRRTLGLRAISSPLGARPAPAASGAGSPSIDNSLGILAKGTSGCPASIDGSLGGGVRCSSPLLLKQSVQPIVLLGQFGALRSFDLYSYINLPGLLDGDFFKSLAKKPAPRFDGFLAWETKYISIKEAQASKREGQGKKRKDSKRIL
ncbi:UNVERIFIED_CONTAM: hypothetical protein Sindi_2108700 [Sesamum indicum]